MQDQPKPTTNVVKFTDCEEVSETVHCSPPPVTRSLFYKAWIVMKWVGAFCVYPFVMLSAAVVLSITGMLQCPVLMIKELLGKSP